MSLAFDEFGRPYLIVREQTMKKRTKGLDAIKANLLAAKAVSDTLRTSLGPKGMDKMMVSPDGEVLVSNDGATIVTKMEIVHPIAQLLVELSKSQDDEIGDGTTGVVVLAGALIKQALHLLDKGLHPLSIANGFEQAADMACSRLEEITTKVDIEKDNYEFLVKAAMVSLGSKIVSKCKRKMAEIARDAIVAVADFERRDVNFDMIKIVPKIGGSLEDTQFINGILIDKDFSHAQMKKEVKDAKIVILTCPFEPPKLKNKNTINITSAEDYKALAKQEQDYFVDMINKVKESGANVAMCQWGFDDEANHLLLQNKLQAVRWVSGTDVELLAIATGARIVPRFEEITAEKLGQAGSIKELQFGTSNQKLLLIDDLKGTKAVSILIRGSSRMVVDETNRSLHDALCVVRNLVKDNRVVVGGGATEMNIALHLRKEADKISSVEQYAVRAFADALDNIPQALAENSGLAPLQVVGEARSKQIAENTHVYGIDCLNACISNMEEIEVFETFQSKKQQIQLASQVIKMILKIDDIVAKADMSHLYGN